jgi:hypothetical protein
LQLRLKSGAERFVSLLPKCAGGFCTCSPSKPLKDKCGGGRSGDRGCCRFREVMRPQTSPRNINIRCGRDIPSCRNQQSCLSTSKRETRSIISSSERSAVIVSLTKMGPNIPRQETAHHITNFKECYGLSWKICCFQHSVFCCFDC